MLAALVRTRSRRQGAGARAGRGRSRRGRCWRRRIRFSRTSYEELTDEELERLLEEEVELEPEVVEAPPEPRVSRLARGLAKTRSALGSTLKALKLREKLDTDSWDEIEEALIRADVGIERHRKGV